ncbi:cellulose synthase (UDP-forming) [Tranquillimonas rosea]|uniref:Cellulose synthase catalytic subunit [UDP-forming] n=1 Tax=Tranquillimonas rosea TaxID=641238 RepID=A0A1H9WKQ1_9RHOB|nr:UDP-forming cellulose synthase catalytic subunit [Tranquillimonas rosea]SES34445.1 cellulose synthase (UDP-forming) [Tranquillimonas rosea]
MSKSLVSRSGATLRISLWFISVACVLVMASIPTTITVQALLGVVTVVSVLVLRHYAHNLAARMAMLGIASVVVLRYWFWRVLHTLPGLDDPVSFVAALLLFMVETFAIGIFFLGNFIMADPVRHKRPAPVSVGALPRVDVLIPTLDEPRDLLAVTLAAARNMAYPPELVKVVLCDDGGTDARCGNPDPVKAAAARKRRRELQELCDELGCIYMTRPENRSAKAGNLNEALSRLDGELVVIFDADHAPTRDFLARTVGYFAENEKLFLVQTPHFFLNDDPVARNLHLGEDTPPENEMFYGQLHEGLDRWGGAFFCGSAAVLRRTALDEVGGISGNTITEDAETALTIHSRGWESMYLNHAMVAGLQPETFASFLQQRGRWATGMMQLLTSKFPFAQRGMRPFQQLCYFNSMTYWLFPLFRLVLLLAPLTYLFFGIELFVTTASEALAYMSSYLIISYVVQNTLYGTTRRPFLSEIYEIAQTPYLVRAVIGALARPKSASFKVTSKTETVTESVLSDVARPLILLFALMLSGVAVLAWRWYALPGDREILQIVGFWVIANALLTGAALRAVVEARQRRASPRCAVTIPAIAGDSATEGQNLPATITDISYGGARLVLLPRPDQKAHRSYKPSERLRFMPSKSFGFDAAAPINGEIANVRTEGGRLVLGMKFAEDQTGAGLRTIAAMLNGDSERWAAIRASRSSHVGLIRGALRMFVLAFAGIGSTVSLVLRPGAMRPKRVEAAESAGWVGHAPIESQAFIDADNTPFFVLSGDTDMRRSQSTSGA